jgi:hypothetical protein
LSAFGFAASGGLAGCGAGGGAADGDRAADGGAVFLSTGCRFSSTTSGILLSLPLDSCGFGS